MSTVDRIYFVLMIIILISLVSYSSWIFLYKDTGEFELVSEMVGDERISLSEDVEVYVKKERVHDEELYTFKYEDEDGKVKEMTTYSGNIKFIFIDKPYNEVEYLEISSGEPLIRVEKKIYSHPFIKEVNDYYRVTIAENK